MSQLTPADLATAAIFVGSFVLGVGAASGTCSCLPAPPRPPIPDTGDGTCDTACARLRELGCEEARPTAEGATCERVCLNVQTSGIVSWDLSCRTRVTACAQVDSCER